MFTLTPPPEERLDLANQELAARLADLSATEMSLIEAEKKANVGGGDIFWRLTGMTCQAAATLEAELASQHVQQQKVESEISNLVKSNNETLGRLQGLMCRCCRSDWPGLCLFCCFQSLCVVS